MKSARKVAYFNRKKRRSFLSNSVAKVLVPVFIILAFVCVWIFLGISSHFWNSFDKLSYVFPDPSGNVTIATLDPVSQELIMLTIPGDTEVDVAMNYGTFRIKSVWQLGVDEKLGGSLLVKTVAKNFSMPVFLWGGQDSASLVGSGPAGTIKFVFFPEKTNIPFGDRVAIALFIARTGNLDRTEINLGDSQFLEKQKLNDGVLGYRLSGGISPRISSYFFNNTLSDMASKGKELKVKIIDRTKSVNSSLEVGSVIQVLGGRVVSVDKTQVEDNTFCDIFGNNARIVEILSKSFDCKVIKGRSDFDVELNLGSKFIF